MTTADGWYLEQFVFDPGSKVTRSKYKFPRELPANKDWEAWFNFWPNYTATGDKLHTPPPSGSMDNPNPQEMDMVS